MESTTWRELSAEAKLEGQRETLIGLLREWLKDSVQPFEPALQAAEAETLAQVRNLLARRLPNEEMVAALSELLVSEE